MDHMGYLLGYLMGNRLVLSKVASWEITELNTAFPAMFGYQRVVMVSNWELCSLKHSNGQSSNKMEVGSWKNHSRFLGWNWMPD